MDKHNNMTIKKMLPCNQKAPFKMVAGAVRICKWKYKNQTIRQSSELVISWISRKKEFTRGAMERTLGFSLGQAEWWIKELRKKGIIKRTKRFEHKLGRGNHQAIYKYVE